jgi:hypothetical protein
MRRVPRNLAPSGRERWCVMLRTLARYAAWLLIAAVFPILFWAALLIVSLVPYLPQR